MSRLSAFCEKLVEACWLAAIIVAPLFFDIYSSRVFEPDKIALIRTLALTILAAWLLLRADTVVRGRIGAKDSKPKPDLLGRLRTIVDGWSRQNPLAVPTLFLIVAYIVSTILSIAPSTSLLGSYQRLQGLYTTLSYILIFFVAAGTIRSQAQIQRAINVALVVSFPIAFYGIIQHFYLDPLPWAGDTTVRVASNMGNSIFVGAFLITVVPLAIGRLIEHTQIATSGMSKASHRILLYASAVVSFIAIAAVWSLSFELGAKNLIGSAATNNITPEMLASASLDFSLALVFTLLVVLAWWTAGWALKHGGTFLLIGIYSLLLAVQLVCILFSQSRGPLLGLLGGIFTLAVLYALVRGARRIALSFVGAAAVVLLFLILFNTSAAAPLAPLRSVPFVGRLGRVFDPNEDTGKVRVLIWTGALKLVLPHAPISSPTTGPDALNLLRPLIGYGPESMYVAYNRFYPPDLAHIESRSATPDRSHNETFDALVTTGLIGWIAENLVFLCVFYFGLKWLGFASTARERNAFFALWFITGAVVGVAFGLSFGWHYIGVAVPAGMILGFFIYVVAHALRRHPGAYSGDDPTRALFLVVLLAAVVSHFIEIHFGIAIVSTRTYFWFFTALFVVIGGQRLAERGFADPASSHEVTTEGTISNARRKRRRRNRESETMDSNSRRPTGRVERGLNGARPATVISTTPLIAFGLLGGLILATMGFDYVSTNNLSPGVNTTLDILITSLTSKSTTAGAQPSSAMLWLFTGTLLVLLAVSVGEWGHSTVLRVAEWVFAAGLVALLALATFSIFLFYQLLALGTTGKGFLDAVVSSIGLFQLFMLLICVGVALTLMFDMPLSSVMISRPTNWIVTPGLALLLAILINSTNVSIIQADVLYKQAAAAANGSTLKTSIDLFHRALDLQPSQDYYMLFLGRSYLEEARTTTDAATRTQDLTQAEQILLRAQQVNPLNTDHTANLARLNQSWAALVADPAEQRRHFESAISYYTQAIALSPYAAHLYDQSAEAEMDYSDFLTAQHDTTGASQARQAAVTLLSQSRSFDSTFCLTYAVQARADSDWQSSVRDSLTALDYVPLCGDAYAQEGESVATQALAKAGETANAAGARQQYTDLVDQAIRSSPSLDLYTALANFYSKTGDVSGAIKETDAAIAVIPTSETSTRQKYQDFRQSLVSLQSALNAVQSSPNDPQAHRLLANLWLARGQTDLALPEYQKVTGLLPNDYDAWRHVALLQVQSGQLVDASAAVTKTNDLAPSADKSFWQRLSVILDSSQKGNVTAALADLNDLLKTVSSNDSLAQNALNALLAKLSGSG